SSWTWAAGWAKSIVSQRKPTRRKHPGSTTRASPPKPAVRRPFPIEKRRGHDYASLFLRAATMDGAMSATYLIDGYNLLYAMGVLGGPVGPHGLEKARLRLLGLLHGSFAEESFTVTVVFDAAAAPAGVAPETDHKGIHVVVS